MRNNPYIDGKEIIKDEEFFSYIKELFLKKKRSPSIIIKIFG